MGMAGLSLVGVSFYSITSLTSASPCPVDLLLISSVNIGVYLIAHILTFPKIPFPFLLINS